QRIAAAASASSRSPSEDSTTRVLGVVVGRNGARVEGAEISIDPGDRNHGLSCRSGAYGQFEIVGVPVVERAHVGATSCSSCLAGDVRLQPGFTDLGELVLREAVHLFGSVVDPEGKPLAGAHVSLSTVGRESTTDSSGRFDFDRVPTGRTELEFERSGFVL